MNWYAIFVKTGEEENVRQYFDYHFNQLDYKLFIPKKKINERKNGKVYCVVKTLFPGYVFIQMVMDIKLYYIIKYIPKVYKILNYTDEFYSKIDNEEMQMILNLTDDNNIIGYSKILVENSKIFIKSGPLKGLEGFIKKIDKKKSRLKIALNLMGTERIVELGIELIKCGSNVEYKTNSGNKGLALLQSELSAEMKAE